MKSYTIYIIKGEYYFKMAFKNIDFLCEDIFETLLALKAPIITGLGHLLDTGGQ